MRHFEMINLLGVPLWIENRDNELVSDDWVDEYDLTPDMVDQLWEVPWPKDGNPLDLITQITEATTAG